MSPRTNIPRDNNPYGPKWLRRRATGLLHPQKLPSPVNLEFVKTTKQESILEGHFGCVNCLEWNHSGTLLASGSDDRQVIIWNPFEATSCCLNSSNNNCNIVFPHQNDTTKCKKAVVKTNHTDNIFSIKFMPQSSSHTIATCAGDAKVLLTDILTSRELMQCNECHFRRVKRLVNHLNQPQLLWSSGEDGLIVQYDLREKHTCKQKSNILIDLNQTESLAAKCLAINPIRDDMLAVGCDDLHVRVFDRRAPQSPFIRFVPGHLKANRDSRRMRTFGTTYLAFSPDGSELLANLHAEQVYLFDLHEPCESFKSFEANLKPLILDKPPARLVGEDYKNFKPKRLYLPNRTSPHIARDKLDVDRCLSELEESSLLSRIDRLNDLIHRYSDIPQLFASRATALIDRNWKGDSWQAFRDCCQALALKPLEYRVITQLADISYRLQNKDIATGLLEIMRAFMNDGDVIERDDRLIRSKLSRFISLEDVGMDEYYEDKPLSIEITTEEQRQPTCDTMLTNLIARQNYRSQQNLKKKSLVEFDYSKRYTGHCNMNTDIKEANFFGLNGEYIVAGSDDGAVYFWDKNTTSLVKAMHADAHILNCIQPHPTICMLATSGIEPTVKIWSPSGKIGHDIRTIEERCNQNQNFLSADPLEAMVMMLYTDH